MDPATPPQRQRQLAPGTELGRYRVVRKLASGGMAEVYLGRADGPGGFAKPVALKLVLPHLAEEPKFVRQFEHEARVAALLNHPNIAQVFEFASDKGELFIAMEFVDGHTLRALLGATEDPLPLEVGLSIVAACCGALDHAHQATNSSGEPLGLVHRDISPSNVMVRSDGVTKVVDFGIAKAMSETQLTRTGSLKGKSGYMSPEQCLGRELTPVSDIFNLGILLYEATLGVRCFGGSNIFDSMQRISDGKLKKPSRVDPDYPVALERIVLRALSTEPAQRHGSAAELRADVERFAAEHGSVLSERLVHRWMEQVMGPALPVDLDITLPYLHEKERRATLPPWARTAIVGGLAGTLVFVALRSTQDETAAPPESPAPEAVPPTRTAPPEPEPVASPEPVPAEPEAVPEPEPAPVEPEPVKPTKVRSKRTTKKPRRKKKSKKDEEREPLFPWKEK